MHTLVAVLLSAALQAPVAVPDWVVADWDYLTAGSGRWVADNSAYKNSGEPWDAYGLEWTYGPGKRSVKGRLFGIARDAAGGSKDSATMWEFLLYWDAPRRESRITQFGSHGVFGIGTASPPSGGHADTIETFYNPDGTTTRTAHRSWKTGDVNRQQSYDVSDDGTWIPRREYIWRREQR